MKTRSDSALELVMLVARDRGLRARLRKFCKQDIEAPRDRLAAFQFREVPYVPGRCFSCGDVLPRFEFGRCGMCSGAWRLAAAQQIHPTLAAAMDDARIIA